MLQKEFTSANANNIRHISATFTVISLLKTVDSTTKKNFFFFFFHEEK